MSLNVNIVGYSFFVISTRTINDPVFVAGFVQVKDDFGFLGGEGY